MKHLLWLVPLVTGLAAIRWPKLGGVALAAILVCGLVGIALLVLGDRGSSLPPSHGEDRSEQNRDPLGVQRDIPPPPS